MSALWDHIGPVAILANTLVEKKRIAMAAQRNKEAIKK